MSGKITKILEPVVFAEGVKDLKTADIVHVGEKKLYGEVIEIVEGTAAIQMYENTAGLKTGEKITGAGAPLSVELGPGLLGGFFDGLGRPFAKIGQQGTDNAETPCLDRTQEWLFTPIAAQGDEVESGYVLGTVSESGVISHKIMVPHDCGGTIETISEGMYSIEEVICTIASKDGKTRKITMLQKWPIRKPRPFAKKRISTTPLYTGQRIIDTMLPIAKGGSAVAVGTPGSGKSTLTYQLAKWAEVDIVVYVGCGDRVNEISDVVEDFKTQHDRRTEQPLISRTVFIANTSGMPIAARECAVYSGVTIAEYYRDMGLEVLLIIDSLTHWAESMRRVCEKLGGIPAEGGYPVYLNSRIAQLYQRGGCIACFGDNSKFGSITLVSTLSPLRCDNSDPVTWAVQRYAKVFWQFDPELAGKHHFPSLNWIDSYSLNLDDLQKWHDRAFGPDFLYNRNKALKILQKEAELRKIAKNFGEGSLAESDQLILHSANMIREDFLQQDAFLSVDAFSTYEKQATLLSLILFYHELCKDALLKNIPDIKKLFDIPACELLGRAKTIRPEEFDEKFSQIASELELQIKNEVKRQAEEGGKQHD
jgi:V/A-type H+-transporting ATPase subunit A